MSSEPTVPANESSDWTTANQHYLLAQMARVRQLIEQQMCATAATGATTASSPHTAPPAAIMQHAQPAALETVVEIFGLSPFERDLLLLCAGIELDASFALLCANAQGNSQQDYPTFSLALAALPAAHWSALAPDAPLRHWQLLHLEAGRSLTRSPLRIDERLLHYLAGVDHLDGQLAALIHPVAAPTLLAPSHAALAEEIAQSWLAVDNGRDLPVIQLCSSDRVSNEEIAAAAAARLGLQLYTVALAALPGTAAEIDHFVRLWQRESLLSARLLLVDCAAQDQTDSSREQILTWLVEAPERSPLLIAGQERRGPWQRPTLTFDVALPTGAEQRAVWQALLDTVMEGGAAALNGQVDRLVGQFNLNLPVIVTAMRGAQGQLTGHANGAAPTPHAFGETLWELCRRQARPRLNDLAQHIDAVATWEELVLPLREVTVLHEIAMHVRHRSRVYDQWGFAGKGNRGLGISALFAGASGTGKTMAAEVLAHELQLDLYRIDLSAVVSKYIGETEKNLRRVFDAAEGGGAILLFDEADALFGKRSDVKDSHDRYANIEVSYLLQRMEAYRGLAILTTNLKDALDSAFIRRIRFIVQFPFPDAEQRAAIWRNIFPKATPVQGLDVEKLARLNVAGGNIRNIALHAAFLAADAKPSEGDQAEITPVGMPHLLAAARREYTKLERPLTETETRDWV